MRAQLFYFLVKIAVDLGVPFVELVTARLSTLQGLEDARDFDFSIVKRENVGIETDDLFRYPALGVLATEEDVKERVDRTDFGERKQGHHRRAGDGEPKPNPVAPCVLHQAGEVFLKLASASGSFFGCTGRGCNRVRPS